MRAHNNGNPLVCAKNLMNMTTYECPFDRLRGRDPGMLDRPLGEAQAVQNAKMILEIYEPRIEPEIISGGYVNAKGDYEVIFNMTDRREGDDGRY